MCYINWRPDYWDEPQHPEPRPLPRLTWATPVDIIELGASLQAYSNLIPQVTTLRLAHRFGGGPLSTLPQEILDHVISDAQEMEKDKVRPKWNEGYRCFSGRCTRGSHHVASEQHTVRLWDELFGSGCGCGGGCGGLGLNSDDYDLEHKANMVVEYFEQDEDDGDFDEMVWDVHNDRQNAWVQQVCLCRRDANPSLKASKFGPLNEMLKKHFGLQANILHEVLSSKLNNFLPNTFYGAECSYHTTCFLVLPSAYDIDQTPSGHMSPHRHDLYLQKDDHLAFHQIVDLSKLNITEQQRLLFASALRTLGLKPHFHLSELEALLTPTTDDKALWAFGKYQITGCPKPSNKTRAQKTELLQDYMQAKNRDLAKRPWPQFMIMATSDAVGPG